MLVTLPENDWMWERVIELDTCTRGICIESFSKITTNDTDFLDAADLRAIADALDNT